MAGCLTHVLPFSLLNLQDCCFTDEEREIQGASTSVNVTQAHSWLGLTHAFGGQVLTLVILWLPDGRDKTYLQGLQFTGMETWDWKKEERDKIAGVSKGRVQSVCWWSDLCDPVVGS